MTTSPFSTEERKLIVRAREATKWARTHPSDWVTRTVEAIHADRQSDDYRDDPDAF